MVKARGMASDQKRGIRAGFLEEVLSDSHLEEGIGVSQVKKNRVFGAEGAVWAEIWKQKRE